MKIPKMQNRFCRFCNKHTKHKVVMGKTGIKRGALTSGQRRHERRSGIHGYGGSPHTVLPEKAKTSKKTPITYQCTICNKKHMRQNNIRLKKLVQE